MDVNKTTHTGMVTTNPTFTTLSPKTNMAVFTLKVRESWVDKSNTRKFRDNLIKIEVLGPKAHWVQSNLKVGRRVMVDGYLRHEQINAKEDLKVRAFRIEVLDNEQFKEGRHEGMKEAFQKALNILKQSDDKEIAQAKMEILLSEL